MSHASTARARAHDSPNARCEDDDDDESDNGDDDGGQDEGRYFRVCYLSTIVAFLQQWCPSCGCAALGVLICADDRAIGLVHTTNTTLECTRLGTPHRLTHKQAA
jgi:hypothetical protein